MPLPETFHYEPLDGSLDSPHARQNMLTDPEREMIYDLEHTIAFIAEGKPEPGSAAGFALRSLELHAELVGARFKFVDTAGETSPNDTEASVRYQRPAETAMDDDTYRALMQG